MTNYILKLDEQNNVRYIMKQKGCAVAGTMSFDSAKRILLGTKKKVRASDEYEGYPITSDDRYFFQGEYEEDETAVDLGADGLPIPAKGVRNKKRMKDVVCE